MTPKEAKATVAAHDLEDRFWGLVRRRIVIGGIAVLLVGAGAGWIAIEHVVQRAVETPLRELQREVVRAEVQADGAKRANETAKASAEQLTAGLDALNRTLQGLGERAEAINTQFIRVDEQINAAAKNANLRSQRDFNAIQLRIAGLEALVKRIGEENTATRKAAADYAKQVATLEAKIEREQKRFAENSAYTISIFFDPSRRALANELQGRLTAVGFRAPTHETPGQTGKNLLTYHGESEAKAQEVLGLVQPIVRDLQATKAPPVKPVPALKGDKKFDFLAGGEVISGFFSGTKWHLDPKSMQLALAAN